MMEHFYNFQFNEVQLTHLEIKLQMFQSIRDGIRKEQRTRSEEIWGLDLVLPLTTYMTLSESFSPPGPLFLTVKNGAVGPQPLQVAVRCVSSTLPTQYYHPTVQNN